MQPLSTGYSKDRQFATGSAYRSWTGANKVEEDKRKWDYTTRTWVDGHKPLENMVDDQIKAEAKKHREEKQKSRR
jgi:hypothetical protein